MDIFVLFFLALLPFSGGAMSSKIGINYGQLGDNLPTPSQSIQLIQTMKAGRVKIYDANPEILKLLSGTNLQVSIMIANQQITNIASNQAIANQWVIENVLPYYPHTMIRSILVGNEVLSYNSDQDRKMWGDLVPTMKRIKRSLEVHNIQDIKVGTPLAMDIMEMTFPPSNGRFRPDILDQVIIPLLRFLNRTNSFFFLDVYPFFPWSTDSTNIDLDFALFEGRNQTYTDPSSGLTYTNLLDQMLDSVIFAMTKLGYNEVRIVISETGWPNAGDVDQPGVNIHNAATYNRNLVKKMTAKPPIGTPARPGSIIPTFLFSLYDERGKGGQETERHWGVFYPNGKPIYELDLSGKRYEYP